MLPSSNLFTVYSLPLLRSLGSAGTPKGSLSKASIGSLSSLWCYLSQKTIDNLEMVTSLARRFLNSILGEKTALTTKKCFITMTTGGHY
jgi:hypothetical protein